MFYILSPHHKPRFLYLAVMKSSLGVRASTFVASTSKRRSTKFVILTKKMTSSITPIANYQNIFQHFNRTKNAPTNMSYNLYHEKLFEQQREPVYTNKHTCSAGLLRAGDTDMFPTSPDPAKISLRMPLIPRSSNVLAPTVDPLAQVARSRIKPYRNTQKHIKTLFRYAVYTRKKHFTHCIRRCGQRCLSTTRITR